MAGIDSQGIKLEFSDDAGSTWTTVPNLTSLDGPTPTAETIDTTALDSTDGYREFITSFKDGGEVTAGINFDPTNAVHQQLWTDFNANTENLWHILFPSGSQDLEWSGYISAPPPVSASVGSVISGNFVVRINGAITATWS